MAQAKEPTPAIEGDLVLRVRAGDSAAESLLVQKYSRGLMFVLRRRLQDDSRAHDIHQETFALVIQKARAGEIRQPEYISRFIRSTALNLAIGEIRKDARRKTYPNADVIASAADPHSCAYCELERSQKSQIIRDLLGELKMPRDREVLARYYLADEDKENICKDLDLSAAHFDRVLFRAKQRFKILASKLFTAGVLDGSSLEGQNL